MSFSDRISEPKNKRFLLLRLEVGRYINDSMTGGGPIYTLPSFPYRPFKVTRNSTQLTDAGIYPHNNAEWAYDVGGGQDIPDLVINSTTAPSSSVIFIAHYYIYITNEKMRALPQNPESAESGNNPLVEWQPRLSRIPTFKQSVKNVLDGVFSIQDTSIEIDNVDADFQQYLSDDDSLHEKNCTMWACLESVSNIQKIYQGKVKSASLSSRSLSLSVYDSFSRLDQPCLMGDDKDEAYYTAAGFSDIYPDDRDKPIPYINGPYSRYTKQWDGVLASSVRYQSLYRAVCTSYTTEKATDENRVWGLCRTGGTLRAPTRGTPNSVSNSTGTLTVGFSVAEWADVEVEIGDYALVTEGGNTNYGKCTRISTSLREIDLSLVGDAPLYAHTTSAVITFSAAPVIFIKDKSGELANNGATLHWGRDFTFLNAVTSGNNNYWYITLANNFETNYSSNITSPVHPDTHDIYFRVRPVVTNHNHADVIEDMLEDVGLTVDSGTFAAAKSGLDALVYCSFPQFDEHDFKTYREYIQLILKSTLGIIYLNNSFEVEYKLLSTPSSSNVIDSDIFLPESVSINIDYSDIITSLIAYNPHNAAQPALVYTQSSSTTVTSTKAQYLHNVDKPVRFRHVLNDISGRLQDILDVRSSRRATYSFRTSLDNLNSEIGDDLQLESTMLLGSASSRDLKILSLDKSLDATTVEATDLEDI